MNPFVVFILFVLIMGLITFPDMKDGIVFGVCLFIGVLAIVEHFYPGLSLEAINFVLFPKVIS